MFEENARHVAQCPGHDWPTTRLHRTRECGGFYKASGRRGIASTHHSGSLEEDRISAAESLTVTAGPGSYFNSSDELKALSTPGAVARVSHRLRSGRASVRREILPVVTSEDIAVDRNPREEFEFSLRERTDGGRDRQS